MTGATTRRNRPYAPRLSPEQRREQLLDLVLEIIDADGVRGVSMDAVARRAGVTRPVVYSHFTDSNHMLRASLDREEQRALAQLDDAMPRPGDEDRAASFHHLFDTYLRAVVEEGCRVGLGQVTLYCLSVENWKRPPRELTFLLKLFRHFLVVERALLMEQSVAVSAMAMVFGAVCCGFLVWNWPPAKIFMGDVGSGYLGYILVVLALGGARGNPTALWC